MTEAQPREPLPGIAVIGVAGRFPGAQSLAELWANLESGKESISFFSRDELLAAGADPAWLADPAFVGAKAVLADVAGFDASFFGLTPREAELMDPQHRLLLECAWEAFEDAGYDPAQAGERTGVYVGSGASLYLLNNLLPNAALLERAGALQVMLLNDRDFLATRLSHKLDLKGPSVLVQTACSTGLVAVHTACQGLLAGEIDLALAGGISISVPQVEGYLYQEGGISSDDGHCRAYDAKATGSVAGNGAGLVLLKRVEDAVAQGDRIYAVIRGTAANNDGADKVGFTAPSVSGQAAVIAESLAMAGVEPRTIALVEGHGSGTALGDPIEVAALREAYGELGHPCALGSVKSNFGHLNTAAGIAGLIKAVLAVERGVIPPSLHFETPNPEADFGPFYVPTEAQPWPPDLAPRRAGVSSFGLGGTNVHAVVEEAPPQEDSDAGREWQLLLVSARSEKALTAACERLAEALSRPPDPHPWPLSLAGRGEQTSLGGLSPSSPSMGEEGRGGEGREGANLADVAFTLHAGRRGFAHRRAVVASNATDAVAALSQGKGAQGVAAPRSVVFLFPGLGDHYLDMARGLYDMEPAFAREIDRCAELLVPILGVDVREIVFLPPSTGGPRGGSGTDLRALLRRGGGVGENAASLRLARTEHAQPILFAVEYALGRLLMDWGIRPAAMIGYSIGEYVAACLAGVLTLEDALALVARRAKLIAALPPGSLLAVPLAEAEIPLSGRLAVAATNGPHLTVVGGPEEEVEALRRGLDERGVVCLRVATTHAFHTPMLAPASAALTELARAVRTKAPEIPYLSNVTGTWITERELADPGYWARHMCRPVRFAEGLDELLAESGRAMVEVGPGGTLTTLVRQHPRGGDALTVTTVRRASEGGADLALLLAAVGALWTAGAAIDAEGFYAGQRRHRVGLPTYPFERTRCWVYPPAPPSPPADGETPHVEEAGRAPLADWFWVPSWRQVPLVPWSTNGEAPPRRVIWKAEEGPVGLVRLCQSLAGSPEPAAVTVVGSGLARVYPGEPVDPARAAVLGAVRLIHQELPALTCRVVDVGGAHDEELLAAEAEHGPAGAVVALRGLQRWVRGFEPVRLGDTEAEPLPAGSVCLITDGVHGAGQAIARQLAKACRVAVVVPADFAGEVAPGVLLVRESDPGRALATAVAEWGRVDAVFHTGGAFSGGLIQLKTADGLAATLDGVTGATEAWMAAMEGMAQPPSRLVLVSSTLAATGGFGQLDIALASAYFDALAEARSETAAPFSTTVAHWDPYQWNGWLIAAAASGMTGLDQQGVAANLAANALPSDDSGEALRRLLAAGLPRVLVAARPLPVLLEEADLATAELLAAQLAPLARGEKAPRPELASAYVAPRNEREEGLVTLWQELFGIAPIGVEDSFLELGGHSLLAIQVVTQVRTHFAADLPVTVLFESPTVALLAKAIGRAKGEESEEDLEALLALVEGLSPEEAAARLAGLEA